MKKFIQIFTSALGVAFAVIMTVKFIAVITVFYKAFEPDSSEFGKMHPIPACIAYNLPIERGGAPGVSIDSIAKDTYLQIYDDFQGGKYMYDFYHGSLPAGEIYLKCYEATKNTPLSPESITSKSKVNVKETDTFAQLVNKQEFTIYEGVWDDYYAARIEVWHKDAKTKEEKKLLEKIYRVEGWER